MLIMSVSANAALRLASLLTDNMVLQQQSQARLWGEANPGDVICAQNSWNKQKVYATADSDGQWQLSISTPKASFDAQTITLSCGKEKVQLKNVLIGEVWLASGQSNMEMPLEGFGGCVIKDGTHDAMLAGQISPYVRVFTVKKEQKLQEQKYCEGHWAESCDFAAALKFSATGYYFASALSNALHVPVGIVNSSYGGAHVEGWCSKQLCETYPDVKTDSAGIYSTGEWTYDRPILMYNAMFCPVKGYTYRGIIWYQGCSNVGHADVYAQRLKDMVTLWRKELQLGDIPFYQVEIAPYEYGDTGVKGAQIREAQMAATKIINNSGIISTNDLVETYEQYNIHPSNKRPVGERLAFLALNETYGMGQITCYGPRYKEGSLRIEDRKDDEGNVVGKCAVMGFDSNWMGIWCKGELKGFEVAGEDRVFHPATATFQWQTNEVTAYSPDVAEPVAVRYCYRDWQTGTLMGGNNLPCFPFRTDKW